MADLSIGPAYTSPGFAVSNTIDDILDKHRLEQRQAMLDALNQQKVQSDIEIQHENALSLAQQRAARAGEYQSQALQRLAAPLTLGQDLSPMGQNQQNDLVKYGYASPAITGESGAVQNGLDINAGSRMLQPNMDKGVALDPEANPTGPESLTSPAPKTKPVTALGSPKEQDAAAQRERLVALQKSGLFDREDISPATKVLLAQEAGITLPNEVLKSQVPLPVFNEDKGTFEPAMMNGKPIMGNEGERPIIRSRPPQVNNSYVGPTPDNTGGIIFNPRAGNGGAFSIQPFPNGQAPGPRPSASGANKVNLPYDPASYNKWLSVASNPNADDNAKNAAKSAAIGTIKDPNVKADVLQLLGNDKYSDLTVDQLIKSGVIEAPQGSSPELSTQYAQTVASILHDFGKQ